MIITARAHPLVTCSTKFTSDILAVRAQPRPLLPGLAVLAEVEEDLRGPYEIEGLLQAAQRPQKAPPRILHDGEASAAMADFNTDCSDLGKVVTVSY